MSKTKILNQVIETSTAMNCMCSELAKNISPKHRGHIHSGSTGAKDPSQNEKRK